MFVKYQGHIFRLKNDWTKWDKEYFLHCQVRPAGVNTQVRIEHLITKKIEVVKIRELKPLDGINL